MTLELNALDITRAIRIYAAQELGVPVDVAAQLEIQYLGPLNGRMEWLRSEVPEDGTGHVRAFADVDAGHYKNGPYR